HMGYPSSVSIADWQTPLGIAKNDSEFGKKLAENSGIEINEESHAEEHSIEVQIPFLQFTCAKFRFSPVMISHDLSFKEAAESIRKTAEQLKREIVVVASSDFTHYGPAYGYVPFTKDAKKNMYALDNGAIELIKKLDSGKYMDYVNSKQATICGQMPIAVLLETIRAKAKKARLMKYYTSGDVTGDYSNAVGYASIVFE
ncbi:AmmeMemoRadiSam system protein B, partial [Candidatus Woesearchaeota archaeon]|nr:AmmeMemoRadiSam system protein B [Candidatus Woesearchaeota archaeon]